MLLPVNVHRVHSPSSNTLYQMPWQLLSVVTFVAYQVDLQFINAFTNNENKVAKERN